MASRFDSWCGRQGIEPGSIGGDAVDLTSQKSTNQLLRRVWCGRQGRRYSSKMNKKKVKIKNNKMNKKGSRRMYTGIYEYISRGVKYVEKTSFGKNILLGISIFAPGGIIYMGMRGKRAIDERKNELKDYSELNLENSEESNKGDLEKKVD